MRFSIPFPVISYKQYDEQMCDKCSLSNSSGDFKTSDIASINDKTILMLYAAADINKVSFTTSVTQQMLHVDLKFTIRT